MVARLIGLAFRLYFRQIKGVSAIGMLLVKLGGMLFGLSMIALILFGAKQNLPELASTWVVMIGSGLILSATVKEILMPEGDMLAAERFCLLPVPGFKLALANIAVTLLKPFSIFLLLYGVTTMIVWADNPQTLVPGIIAVPFALLIAVLLSKVIAGFLAKTFASKNLRMIILGFLFIVFYLGMFLFKSPVKLSSDASQYGPLQDTVWLTTFTPFGAGFGLPYHIARGESVAAAVSAFIALFSIVCLWLVFRKQTEARLANPVMYRGGAKVKSGGFIDRLFPATAFGVIAARLVKNHLRDPRYIMSFAVSNIAIVMMGVVYSKSVPHVAIPFLPCVIGLLMISVVGSGASYDYKGFATHIIAGVRGIDDRRARALISLLLYGPVPMIAAVVLAVVFDEMELILPAFLAVFTMALCGAGVGSVTGVYFPTPTARPGDSPFGRRKGTGNNKSAFVALGGLVFISVLTAIPITFTIIGLKNQMLWLAGIGSVLSLLVAFGALFTGLKIAGKKLDKQWDKLYLKVTKETK